MSVTTLNHIAKAAKLSVASVSRALTDNPVISEQTRKRVREISERMGYQPRPRRTRDRFGFARVGFVMVVPDSGPSSDDISSSHMARIARTHRLRVDLHFLAPTADDEAATSLLEIAGQCDALLIYGRVNAAVLGRLAERGVRAVMLGNPEGGVRAQPPVVVVTSDMLEMGRRATQRLIDAGHRRIAFATGSLEPGMWADCWLDGYRLAHAGSGVPLAPEMLLDLRAPGPQGSVARWWSSLGDDPPTAFVFPDWSVRHFVLEELGAIGAAIDPRHLTVGERKIRAPRPDQLPWPMVLEDSDAMIEYAMAQLRLAIDGGLQRPATILVPFQTANFDIPADARRVGSAE